MKKKLFKFIMQCIILTAAVHFGQPLQAYAASAAIGFRLSGKEILVDQIVNVYLTIDADIEIGDVEAYISYDSDYLEFHAANGSIAGGDGVLKLSDVDTTVSNHSKIYLMKFTACKPGKTQISIMNQPKVYEAETARQMSVSTTVAEFYILPQIAASDDAGLMSLKISPGVLQPAFDPEVYEYRTSVSNEVGSVYVSAIPNDDAARVTISGNAPLYPGENTVHIFVTAESGTIKEYRITVIKEGEASITPTGELLPPITPTTPPLPEEEFVWKLEALEEDGTVYLEGNYRFIVCDTAEGIELPTGYEKTKLTISGIQIVAYTPKASTVGDFALLVLRREDGTPKLYRYDRVEKTIQRFMTEDVVISREESEPSETLPEETIKRYQDNITLMGFIIAALTIVWLVTAIGLIYFIMKSKGMRDDID